MIDLSGSLRATVRALLANMEVEVSNFLTDISSEINSQQKAFEVAIAQCIKCIEQINQSSWQPNSLFDACVDFLVGMKAMSVESNGK